MRHRCERGARGELRILEDVGDAVDRAARELGAFQRLHERCEILAGRPCCDDLINVRTVRDALTCAREARIADQPVLAH
jgi:hypothetical protein